MTKEPGKESPGSGATELEALMVHKRWRGRVSDCADTIISNPASISDLRAMLQVGWATGPNEERIAALLISLSLKSPDLLTSLLAGDGSATGAFPEDPDASLAIALSGSLNDENMESREYKTESGALSLSLWLMGSGIGTWSEVLEAGVRTFDYLDGFSLWRAPWAFARAEAANSASRYTPDQEISFVPAPVDSAAAAFQELLKIGILFPGDSSELSRDALMTQAPEILDALSTPPLGSEPETHAKFVFASLHLLRFLSCLAAAAVADSENVQGHTFRAEIRSILSRVFESGRLRLTALLSPRGTADSQRSTPDKGDFPSSAAEYAGPSEFMCALSTSVSVLSRVHSRFVEKWHQNSAALPGPGCAFFAGAFETTGNLIPPWANILFSILDSSFILQDNEIYRQTCNPLASACGMAYLISRTEISPRRPVSTDDPKARFACLFESCLENLALSGPPGATEMPPRELELALSWAISTLRVTMDEKIRRLMLDFSILLFCLADGKISSELAARFNETNPHAAAAAKTAAAGITNEIESFLPENWNEVLNLVSHLARFEETQDDEGADHLGKILDTACKKGPEGALWHLNSLNIPCNFKLFYPIAFASIRRLMNHAMAFPLSKIVSPMNSTSGEELMKAWPFSLEPIVMELSRQRANEFDFASLIGLCGRHSAASGFLRSAFEKILTAGATIAAVLALLQILIRTQPAVFPSGGMALVALTISFFGLWSKAGNESKESRADSRGKINSVILLLTWSCGGAASLLVFQMVGGCLLSTAALTLSVSVLGMTFQVQPFAALCLAAASTLFWPVATAPAIRRRLEN